MSTKLCSFFASVVAGASFCSLAAAQAAPAAAPPAVAPSAQADVPARERDTGFGTGATIRSADERFSLNIRGRIQARATVLDRPDPELPITEMLIRRMRVVLQGDALRPQLTYYIQLSFANQDMEPDLRSPLRDAYFTYQIGRDANCGRGR